MVTPPRPQPPARPPARPAQSSSTLPAGGDVRSYRLSDSTSTSVDNLMRTLPSSRPESGLAHRQLLARGIPLARRSLCRGLDLLGRDLTVNDGTAVEGRAGRGLLRRAVARVRDEALEMVG